MTHPGNQSIDTTPFTREARRSLINTFVEVARELARPPSKRRRRYVDRNFESIFFEKWFREDGHGYFFLFKRNLTITNIQHAELLALLRQFAQPESGTRHDEYLIRSPDLFSQSLGEMLALVDDATKPAAWNTIADTYGPLLMRTIVYRTFYGSAAVYLPPGLDVDLARLCGVAGYIHSCGPEVYVRSTDKADPFWLSDNVRRHVSTIPAGRKVPFIVYAHEDFQTDQGDDPSLYRHGLDGVKIYIDKYDMKDKSLAEVLNQLRRQPRLWIPSAGNAKRQKEAAESSGQLFGPTLWLLVDTSVMVNARPQRGPDRYYICYQQAYKNENPFHVFDENMPAWVNQTTIPHTLATAMINLTRPWSDSEGSVVVVDPFVGTGTMWLAALADKQLDAYGFDIDQQTRQLVNDNLQFFAMAALDLERLAERIDTFANEIEGSADPSGELGTGYHWASTIEDGASSVSADDWRKFDVRLAYYLVERTLKRSGRAIARGSKGWTVAIVSEARLLTSQTRALARIRRRQESLHAVRVDNLVVYPSTYSDACSIDAQMLAEIPEIRRNDARIKGSQNAVSLKLADVDAVVTDPPYGFNTRNELEQLAKLYAGWLRTAISWLGEHGQLVFCLPERSHSGRRIPFFAQRLVVSQQVLTIARELDREVYLPAQVVPHLGMTSFFLPPYYWESERALRRSVMHFHIRPRRSSVLVPSTAAIGGVIQ